MSNNSKAIQQKKKQEQPLWMRVKHFKWEVDSGNNIFKRIGQSYFMNYSFNREQNTKTSCTQHVRLQRIRSRSVSPSKYVLPNYWFHWCARFCFSFQFSVMSWYGVLLWGNITVTSLEPFCLSAKINKSDKWKF